MSNLSQFLASGGGKLFSQEFTSSGTFVPSAGLIANGGKVFVTLIGGGGGGGGSGSGISGGGGDAGQYVEVIVNALTNTSVVIGAGGNGAPSGVGGFGGTGGNSAFGSVLALGGKGGVTSASSELKVGGSGAGGNYRTGSALEVTQNRIGGRGINGRAGGGTSNFSISFDGGGNNSAPDGIPGTGGGGAGLMAGNGGSGWCRVVWFE